MVLPTALAVIPQPPLDGDAGSGRDAGATPETAIFIESGSYQASLAPVADAIDLYAFDAVAGQSIESYATDTSYTHNVRREIVDPSGGVHDGWRTIVATASGTHFIRVFAPGSTVDGTPSPVLDYRLSLAVKDRVLQNDAGTGGDAGDTTAAATRLPDGVASGMLDAADGEDVYWLPTQVGETVRIQFSHDGHAYWYWFNAQGRYGNPAGDGTNIVSQGGPLYLRVSGYESTYTLDVARDAAPPTTDGVHVVLRGVPSGDMATSPDGAVVFAHERGAFAINADDTVDALDTGAWGGGGAAIDAEGNAYLGRYGRVDRLESDGAWTPVSAAPGNAMQFGPDGRLHVVRDQCRHTIDDQREGYMGSWSCWGEHLAFHPDGREFWASATRGGVVTYLNGNWGSYQVVAQVPDVPQGIAFDQAGRLYVANDQGDVYRFDLTSGTRELLASGFSAPVQLQFAGTRLYVSSGGNDTSQPYANAVSWLDLGVVGFEGFRPTFDLPPIADLTVRIIDETPVEGTSRRAVTVEVENVGEGRYVGNWFVTFQPVGYSGTLLNTAYHYDREGLAAGATRTLVFEWDTTYALGDQTLRAQLRTEWGVEATRANNEDTFDTHVLVRGHGRLV